MATPPPPEPSAAAEDDDRTWQDLMRVPSTAVKMRATIMRMDEFVPWLQAKIDKDRAFRKRYPSARGLLERFKTTRATLDAHKTTNESAVQVRMLMQETNEEMSAWENAVYQWDSRGPASRCCW